MKTVKRLMICLVLLQVLHTGLMCWSMWKNGDFGGPNSVVAFSQGQATVTVTQTAAQAAGNKK